MAWPKTRRSVDRKRPRRTTSAASADASHRCMPHHWCMTASRPTSSPKASTPRTNHPPNWTNRALRAGWLSARVRWPANTPARNVLDPPAVGASLSVNPPREDPTWTRMSSSGDARRLWCREYMRAAANFFNQVDYKYLVASAFVFGLFMDILDTTILNVALPRLAEEFRASTAALSWVVTGY